MASIKRASLVDQLYDQIRAEIIAMTYPMGCKLNVNELQDVYGVSSTPLREAITRLQAEGLVTYENNVGARVISLTADDIIEIQDLAFTLHSAAVRFAMERGDRARMIEEIKHHAEAYQNAKTGNTRIKHIFGLLGTFYRFSGNARLDMSMKIIQGQQLMLRYLYYDYLGTEKAYTDHFSRMAKAVEEGDTEKVIEILGDNFNRATPVLVAALETVNRGEASAAKAGKNLSA